MTHHGFTLLELLVVIGITVALATVALPIGANLLQSYTLNAERDSFVTLLEGARDAALANANQSAHGIEILPGSYTVFTGQTYATRTASNDELSARSSTVAVAGPTEVVFQPLSGRTAAAAFTLSSGSGSLTVTINSDGQIDW